MAVPPPDKDFETITAPNPRRSSRRTGTAKAVPAKGAASFPHVRDFVNLKDQGLTQEETVKTLEKQIEGAQLVVDDNMQSLEALGLAFEQDTKRRKLQVNQSTILNFKDENATAFYPRMVRGDPVTLHPEGLLLSPERNTEPCVETGDAWEGILEAENDANDDVVQTAERGGKRAPAVNSAYLPLPWKGRLGYVGPLSRWESLRSQLIPLRRA